MSTPVKTARVEMRLTDEQKASIEAAARISGKTVAEFGIPLLVEAAERVLDDESRRLVSVDELREFTEIIARPSQRIDAVARLFARPSPFVE